MLQALYCGLQALGQLGLGVVATAHSVVKALIGG